MKLRERQVLTECTCPKSAEGDERCRTAALGGHVARCENEPTPHAHAYHRCRNRHCPKCQAELLSVDYYFLSSSPPVKLSVS
jgi:hypothetical protein